MARISDLPLWLRVVLRAYPWRRIDPVPTARLEKPLTACRVALVTTAGLVPPGDAPFDEHVKGGDYSYRVIRSDADVRELEEHHRSESFDHAGILEDANLAFRSIGCASWPRAGRSARWRPGISPSWAPSPRQGG